MFGMEVFMDNRLIMYHIFHFSHWQLVTGYTGYRLYRLDHSFWTMVEHSQIFSCVTMELFMLDS